MREERFVKNTLIELRAESARLWRLFAKNRIPRIARVARFRCVTTQSKRERSIALRIAY